MQIPKIQKLLASSSVSNYAALARVAQKLVPTEAIIIYVWKRQKFVKVYSSGFSTKLASMRNKMFLDILHGKKPTYFASPRLENKFLYVPLMRGSKEIGIMIMHIFAHKKFLSQKELEMLTMYGSIAGLVMQRLELKKELYKARRIQKSMVNTTAHNLRTPLTSLAVYIRLFKKKEKNKQKLIWLQGISTASQRLALVADDLVKKKE